jgi:hypothetical protein
MKRIFSKTKLAEGKTQGSNHFNLHDPIIAWKINSMISGFCLKEPE